MANLVDFEYRNAEEWRQESPEAVRPRVTRVLMRVGGSHDVASAGQASTQILPQGKKFANPKTVVQPRKFPVRSLNSRVPPKNIRLGDSLPGERDNAAKAAWRRRTPATGKYELPCRYDRLDVSTFRDEKPMRTRTLARSLDSVLEQIGYQTGTYIEPPSNLTNPVSMDLETDEIPANLCALKLLRLWGTEDQVEAAKGLLRGWIARSQEKRKAEGRNGWGKANAEPSPRRKALLDKELREITRSQSFRRTPNETEAFASVGFFLTPVKDFDAIAVLGANLEAFDSIRARCSCHVIFDSKRSLFKILSNDVSLVQEALCRIRVAFCEMASQNSKARKLYVVTPPESNLLRQEVELKAMDLWVSPVAAGPRASGTKVNDWNSRREELKMVSGQEAKCIILQTLADINFFRGHAQIRVHFGKMLLSMYKKPSGVRHTFEEFCAMLLLPRTRAEVNKSIGSDENAAVIMSRCFKATDVFVPRNAMESSLESISPVISAHFEFSGKKPSQLIRLEVEFQKMSGESEYEITAIRWLKGLNGSSEPIQAKLDIINLVLDKSLAWQFRIDTAVEVEGSKISRDMREFVKLLRIEVLDQRKPSQMPYPKVKFVNLRGLKLRSFIQQVKFQYLMVDSDYVFELTRHERYSRDCNGSETAFLPTKGLNLKADVAWGASLFNAEWDRFLEKQVDLEVGMAGDWLPNLETVFPVAWRSSDDSSLETGFGEFLDKIGKLVDIVNGS